MDEGDDIVVTAKRCAFTALPREVDSHVYDDYGSGYFGDFNIEFEAEITASDSQSILFLCAVSNTIGSGAAWISANDAIRVQAFNNAGSLEVRLKDENTDNVDNYVDGGSTMNLLYFTFERSSTTATLKIYSDSTRQTLVDTLTITCETGTKQYLYCCASRDDANAATITGYTQNFEIVSS